MDTDGEVFIPYMEYYKRREKAIKTKPIFPNYMFIYTSVEPMCLHKKIRDVVGEIRIGVRELGFKEQYNGKFIGLDEVSEGDMVLYTNVSDAEKQLLDLLRQGDGLLTMSAGYEENKKYIVMEGPLKAYWFPSEDSSIVKLEDGTEVDVEELKRNVMTI